MTMAQMRAVLVRGGKGPIENLYIGQAPRPVASPSQLLVKVKACGLNRMDLSQREGNYPPPPGSSDILGVEFSGIVDEVGSAVSKFKSGDEVFGLVGGGGYAEYAAIHETHAWRKPAGLSWEEAASIPETFITAFQALVLGCNVKKTDKVMIHAGASGVGVAANQLARYFGCETVITTASSDEKLAWLRSMTRGPTHTVNYKTQNFADEVKGITDGKGVDAIVDFVGKSHWEGNISSLAMDGRMVLLSFLSGANPQVDLRPILYKRLRIQGSTLRARTLDYQAELIGRMKDVIGDITGEGGAGPLRTYVYKVYPWSDVQEAHKDMAANKNSGKLVLRVE